MSRAKVALKFCHDCNKQGFLTSLAFVADVFERKYDPLFLVLYIRLLLPFLPPFIEPIYCLCLPFEKLDYLTSISCVRSLQDIIKTKIKM